MFSENEVTAVLVDALLQKMQPGEQLRVEKASVSSGDPGDYVIRVDAIKDPKNYVLSVQPIKEAQARDRGIPEGAVVRYRHWRRATDEVGLYMKHLLAPQRISAKGGQTQCLIEYKHLSVNGYAHVNPDDVYCKATGRDYALTRALVMLYRIIDTQAEKDAVAALDAVAAADAERAEQDAS